MSHVLNDDWKILSEVVKQFPARFLGQHSLTVMSRRRSVMPPRTLCIGGWIRTGASVGRWALDGGLLCTWLLNVKTCFSAAGRHWQQEAEWRRCPSVPTGRDVRCPWRYSPQKSAPKPLSAAARAGDRSLSQCRRGNFTYSRDGGVTQDKGETGKKMLLRGSWEMKNWRS